MNDPEYAPLTFAEMADLPEFEPRKDFLLQAEEAWNQLNNGEDAEWFFLI